MDDSWALGAAGGQQFHPEPWGSRDGNVTWKTCSSSMYFSFLCFIYLLCFQLLRALLFVFTWEQLTHPLLGPFTA